MTVLAHHFSKSCPLSSTRAGISIFPEGRVEREEWRQREEGEWEEWGEKGKVGGGVCCDLHVFARLFDSSIKLTTLTELIKGITVIMELAVLLMTPCIQIEV